MHRALQSQPVLSIAVASEKTKLTVPTVTAALERLVKLGMALEATKRNYGRIYAYDRYLQILSEGTAPL